MLIEFIPTFAYFSQFTAIKRDAKVLDFGSNCGNFLKSSRGFIAQKNYTGIDVDAHAIEEGKKNFPDATWVSYDRFNPVYNKSGSPTTLPSVEDKFDLIVSYSVFTHTSIEDTLEMLDYLYERLNVGGSLFFTYCNVDRKDCTEWFRNKRGPQCDIIPSVGDVYLVNDKISYHEPRSAEHFVSFYQTEWLAKQLSKFNPTMLTSNSPWTQDCVKITRI